VEKATEVSRELAKEIIPWFRVPISIRPDNGPAFVSQEVKGISRVVGLTWDLHKVSPPITRPSEKDEQYYQDSTSKTMSRDRATLARIITLGTVQN
jgi:hypothetical protein